MRNKHLRVFILSEVRTIKCVYFGPKEISRLADKGQFQYLTGLKGPEKGLSCINKVPFTGIDINILSENT